MEDSSPPRRSAVNDTSKRNPLRQSQGGSQVYGHKITAENMTKKQEALLKNRLKNLVK
jgi:hypothetical protein